MATREEITGAIRLGIEAGEQTFSGLSDEQLATKIYPGDDGWTAKEILAHLAGRQGTYDMVLSLAGGGAMPQASEGGFDVDSWNQRVVDERIDQPRDDLIAEFRVVHEDLINRVNQLSDDVLAATVTTPRGQTAAGEVLLGSGGMHSVNHSNDVAEALGLERG